MAKREDPSPTAEDPRQQQPLPAVDRVEDATNKSWTLANKSWSKPTTLSTARATRAADAEYYKSWSQQR